MSRRIKFERWDEIKPPTDANYLIEGWYDRGSLVLTHGKSNSGKSNEVLSQAIAIATGSEWCNCRTHRGAVAYCALEGGRGIRGRIAAYKKRFSWANNLFVLVTEPLDLRTEDDVEALIRLVEEACKSCGTPCAMVVIDTLSRAMPGGDENSPKDMTAVIRNCDRIRQETGATCHIIHHTGKNEAGGARGHSSLQAAADTEIEVKDGTILVTKQRDIADARRASFEYETIKIGVDDSGSPVTSIVTRCQPGSIAENDYKHDRCLIALRDLIFERAGKMPEDPTKYDPTEVTPELREIKIGSREWKTKLGITKNDSRADKDFERHTKILAECGIIGVDRAQGKENQYHLIPRQTTTNPDMSESPNNRDNPDTPL